MLPVRGWRNIFVFCVEHPRSFGIRNERQSWWGPEAIGEEPSRGTWAWPSSCALPVGTALLIQLLFLPAVCARCESCGTGKSCQLPSAGGAACGSPSSEGAAKPSPLGMDCQQHCFPPAGLCTTAPAIPAGLGWEGGSVGEVISHLVAYSLCLRHQWSGETWDFQDV